MKFPYAVAVLILGVAVGCTHVGPTGMTSLLAKQSAKKAKGKTYGPDGHQTGEWETEGYDSDGTPLVKEAGATARSYFWGQNAENILPQIMRNPNVTPPIAKNPNVIPANPNVIPKNPNVIPADPNVIPVNPNIP